MLAWLEVTGLAKYCGINNAQNSHFSFLGMAFGAVLPIFNVLRLRRTQHLHFPCQQLLPCPSPAALPRRKT